MSKYYITVNPHGGTKKGPKILSEILPVFESKNAEVTIIETEYAGHATDLTMEVDMTSYDGFCCIGGDGTCLLYTSPSPRDMRRSRMPSSA